MEIKIFTFSPFEENTYVVYDETKEAVIIDAGCLYEKEKKELKDFIDSNNLILKHLINTHLHLDHQFGNRFISDTYNILPQAHKADEFFIEKYPQQLARFGFKTQEPAPSLGGYLDEKDTVSFGNTSLQILHVPGHSPGSLAYYNEKEGILFSGDVLFNGSIGRTDLEQGDYATLIRSISNKLLVLPDNTVVHCGHGETTTIGHEKQYNPYL